MRRERPSIMPLEKGRRVHRLVRGNIDIPRLGNDLIRSGVVMVREKCE